MKVSLVVWTDFKDSGSELKLWRQHVASCSTEMFPAACSLAAGFVLICVTEEHLNALHRQKFYCILGREWKFSTGFMVAHTFHSLKSQELPVLKSARAFN
jgi:hypothetical protein